mmetsp:Transcript_6574/g.21217  ORF Transcript_6574/g.21217 Transcript_6574/m.21217 type:complete len:207 (-) Transcript_6574:349-969(-)
MRVKRKADRTRRRRLLREARVQNGDRFSLDLIFVVELCLGGLFDRRVRGRVHREQRVRHAERDAQHRERVRFDGVGAADDEDTSVVGRQLPRTVVALRRRVRLLHHVDVRSSHVLQRRQRRQDACVVQVAVVGEDVDVARHCPDPGAGDDAESLLVDCGNVADGPLADARQLQRHAAVLDLDGCGDVYRDVDLALGRPARVGRHER